MNILRFVIPKSLVVHLYDDATVRQALEKMRFHKYTAVPVIEKNGRYLGTLHNDDIFAYFLESGDFNKKSAQKDAIRDIIDPAYSRPLLHSADMYELIDRVKEHNFVPIVDDRGCFIGIILRRDVLNFLSTFYKDEN